MVGSEFSVQTRRPSAAAIGRTAGRLQKIQKFHVQLMCESALAINISDQNPDIEQLLDGI